MRCRTSPGRVTTPGFHLLSSHRAAVAPAPRVADLAVVRRCYARPEMKPPKETTDSPIQATWWSCPGILYFFAAGDPPAAIKVGVAALANGCTLQQGVTRRFKAIQSCNHETVELLGLVHFTDGQYPTRSAEVLERELHIQFAAHQRFKPGTRGGEWFTPSPELLTYIREHTQSPEALSVPRFIGQPINRQ